MKYSSDIGARDVLLHLNNRFVGGLYLKLLIEHRKFYCHQIKHSCPIAVSDENARKRNVLDELPFTHLRLPRHVLILVDKAVLVIVADNHGSSAEPLDFVCKSLTAVKLGDDEEHKGQQ
jgi:hypothetical protein